VVKKSNHQANITLINDVQTHNNADTLEIIRIEGYQCVSKKGQFKPGDLAVYIQPDSVVPQTRPFRFIWEPYQADPDGAVPEKRRRITVRKFRGEWSEGLLLPLTDFMAEFRTHMFKESARSGTHIDSLTFEAGQDVSELLGITHYDPDAGVESTKGDCISGPRRKYPRTAKGWFFFVLHKFGFKSAGKQLHEEVGFRLPVYDVEAYKNHTRKLQENEQVVVTEKIHGSNARFTYLDGKMYAGSRTFWKAPNSNCVWRKALQQNPWIETWCKAHEGFALYGEVVPTQKGFDYGCKPGQVKFFVFDILDAEEWKWIDHDATGWMLAESSSSFIDYVPVLYAGPFNEQVKTLVDGPSQVRGAKHIREGIVIKPTKERRVPGLGRVILKIVSNAFLEKDSKAA
jgi:hypothetical protein